MTHGVDADARGKLAGFLTTQPPRDDVALKRGAATVRVREAAHRRVRPRYDRLLALCAL